MMIYIAGPYRATEANPGDLNAVREEINQNILNARELAVECWREGHTVICPHLNTAHFDAEYPDISDEVWLNGAIELMKRCDAVCVVLEDEDKSAASTGTQAEITAAEKMGIPIYYGHMPGLHPTEIRSPIQCNAFIETLMAMYRLHLSKNKDYCMAPGHKVLTDQLLWKNIEDIQVGDTLIGFDEYPRDETVKQARRMYRPSLVEAAHEVTLPSVKITLSNNHQFICSEEHIWLVKQGSSARWCAAKNLQPKDTHSNNSKLLKLLDTWEPLDGYEAGYLAAAFDSEGWLSQCDPKGKANGHKRGKSMTLGFSQKKNAMWDYMISIMDSWNIPYRYRRTLGKPRSNTIKLIGQIQPKRLLENLSCNLGMIDLRNPVDIQSIKKIGDQKLIALRTSTGTFLADGYATHNSPSNILGTGKVGVIVRLWDKIARLMNLTGFNLEVTSSSFDSNNAKDPEHEALTDTFLDAANYSVIAKLLYEDKWGK